MRGRVRGRVHDDVRDDVCDAWRWGSFKTYSSLMKLLTERPPQLMPPPIKLPARLSRRTRLASPRLGLIMEMGLGPALTKESWRPRFMAASKGWPDVMLPASMSRAKAVGVPIALPSLRSLSRSASKPEDDELLRLVVVGVVVVEEEDGEDEGLMTVVGHFEGRWCGWLPLVSFVPETAAVVVVAVVVEVVSLLSRWKRSSVEKRQERRASSARKRRCFAGGDEPAKDEERRRRVAVDVAGRPAIVVAVVAVVCVV